MPADSDLIDYSSTGANRPECYWKGDYKIMDLSDQYQHVKVYDSSAYIGSVKTKMQKEQSRTLGRIFAGFISFFVFAFCAAMAFCLLPRYNTYWIYPVLCLSVLLLSYHQRHTSD